MRTISAERLDASLYRLNDPSTHADRYLAGFVEAEYQCRVNEIDPRHHLFVVVPAVTDRTALHAGLVRIIAGDHSEHSILIMQRAGNHKYRPLVRGARDRYALVVSYVKPCLHKPGAYRAWSVTKADLDAIGGDFPFPTELCGCCGRPMEGDRCLS